MADSKRKDAIQRMVVQLKTITAGATYLRTLSAGDAVFTKVKLMNTAQEGSSFIWVRPGFEDTRIVNLGGVSMEGTFEILLDCYVKDATGDSMVEELEDLLHDISLCLGDDRTLNGAVSDSVITRIEPPVYGLEEMWAMTTVHVVCIYDFEYGNSI